jgi:hypothetical protein
MEVGEIIKLLEDDGWVHVRMKGSHRQFKHPSKPGFGNCRVVRKLNVSQAIQASFEAWFGHSCWQAKR